MPEVRCTSGISEVHRTSEMLQRCAKRRLLPYGSISCATPWCSVPDEPVTCNSPDFREIIRDVVREEIQKLLPAAASPASPSIAEIVREEVHQALQPEVLVGATPEPPTLSYAAATRRSPPPAHRYTAPPRRAKLYDGYNTQVISILTMVASFATVFMIPLSGHLAVAHVMVLSAVSASAPLTQ
ncbi:hypothetical protein HPB47_015786, partial [Ixodes persulcatus]